MQCCYILLYSYLWTRIPWNTKVESYSQPYRGKEETENGRIEGDVDGNDEGEGSDEDDDDENEDDDGGKVDGEGQSSGYTLQQMQLHAKMVVEDAEDEEGGEVANNSCQLLWQGIQSKRAFTGFKFQVLHYTTLYPTLLKSIWKVQCYTVLYRTVLFCAVLYCTDLHHTPFLSFVLSVLSDLPYLSICPLIWSIYSTAPCFLHS